MSSEQNKVKFMAAVESATEKELGDQLYAQKRIGMSEKDAEGLAKNIISMINYINSLNEFTATAFAESIPVNEVMVHQIVADLIRPRTVRYINSDRTNKDLIVRSNYTGDVPSYSELMQLWKRVNGIGKQAAGDNLVSLATVRIDKSFEDVRLKAYFPVSSSKVRDENSDFYPVPLSINHEVLFDDDYLNVEAKSMINRYFANKIFY